jgi:putative hydrolase of the HAD superfamily
LSTIKSKLLKSSHKAVFFDAGGTLLEPYPSVGHIYSQYAKKYGYESTPDALNEAFQKTWDHRNGLSSLQLGISTKEESEWWRQFVKDVFDRIKPMDDFDTFFDELYDAFLSGKTWKIFDDVKETLEALKKKGLYLAIISNWDSRLIEICKGMDLGKYFDEIFVSALVRYAKPDSRIFQKAADTAGVLPEEAVHIGDSLEDDYYGAKDAGMDALYLDRDGRRKYPDVAVIRSLREIC